MRNIHMPRTFWWSVGLVIVFNSCFAAWTIFKPGTPELFSLVDNIGELLGWCFGALLCFIAIKKPIRPNKGSSSSPRSTLQFWIPLLFGLGQCGSIIGQAIYIYNEVYHFSLFPSWSDAGFLSTYPFFLLGILLLPTRTRSGATRSRVLLDGLMILTAIITFSWYFTLGPTILQATSTLFARIIGTAYPASDLILVCCTILLLFRSVDPSLRPALYLLTLSLIIIVLVDSAYDYQLLQGTYQSSWQDIGWPLGYMLLALSAQILSWSPNLVKKEESSPLTLLSLWRTFLPYMLIPLILLLTVYIWHMGNQGLLALGVYSGGTMLLIMIFARQLLAIREIHHLNAAVHASNDALHTTQLTLHERNQELGNANNRLEILATTDPLTELPNHRALVDMLTNELEHAQQSARTCTIFFLDIDHFKALNDGYGHTAGDTILHEFSHLVRSTIRSMDIIGRWGGEEFVAIVPELSCEDASTLAEHIRSTVSNHLFTIGGGIRLTCSIGLSTFPEHASLLEALVTAADHAMYGAKTLGRNQVRIANDPKVLALQSDEISEGGREETAITGTVDALMKLIEIHEPTTLLHSQQVSELLSLLAHAMHLSRSEIQMLIMAGQLHDLGKIAIPDTLLQQTGPFTAEEWHIIHLHPIIGAEIIGHIPALRTLAPVIRAHHERWDGQGYPDHLLAEAIPLGARMLTIVNTYITMTTDKPYQSAWSHTTALRNIQQDAGSRFDPHIVEVLSDLLQEPVHIEQEISRLPVIAGRS